MFVQERLRLGEAARDERRRHELREVEDEHLFGRVADLGGIVDHQGLATDALQQVGGGDVAEVERRVLAHQHYVGVAAQIQADGVGEREMVALDALDRDGMRLRPDAAVAVVQVLGGIVKQAMTARLRRQHQRERGIPGDGDAGERVHLDGDGEGHGRLQRERPRCRGAREPSHLAPVRGVFSY